MFKQMAQPNKTLAQEKKSLVLFLCSGLVRVASAAECKMSLAFDLASPYHFMRLI